MKYEDARNIIISDLKALAEDEYRHFNTRIIFTVPPECVIGVKTGGQRDIAKKYFGTEVGEAFMGTLPHHYFEEYQVHAFMLERVKDRESVMSQLEQFLPLVDNWATCDQLSPKVFKKAPPSLAQISAWMADKRPYVCRFGMGMLMRYYLDERFEPAQLDMIADVPWEAYDFRVKEGGKVGEVPADKRIRQGSDVYYINMMRAWYFATALAKQYDATLPLIQAGRLDKWTHNKAIQKARESFRVSDEHKEVLRGLRK